MKQVVLKTAYFFLIGFVATNFACSSHAQDPTRYIPKTAFASMTIRLDKIRDCDSLKFVPILPLIRGISDGFGIDSRRIDSLKLVFARLEGGDETMMGVVANHTKEIDGLTYFKEQFGEGSIQSVDIAGTPIIQINETKLFAVQVSEKTMVVSEKEHFALIMSESKNEKTDLTKLILDGESDAILKVCFAKKQVADWFEPIDENRWKLMSAGERMEQLLSCQELVRNCETIALDFDWNDEGVSIRSVLTPVDSDSAKELSDTVVSMLDMVHDYLSKLKNEVESENRPKETVEFMWIDYQLRIIDYVKKNLKPTVRKNRVIIQHRDKNAGPLVTTLLVLIATNTL